MLAFLFSLALFAVWSAIGLAGLVAVRADVAELRVVLSAPIFGSALSVIPLFVLSNAGVPMKVGGPPTFAVLVLATIVVLVVRRPRVPLTALPVVGIGVVGVVLLGRPMLDFGFDWIASASGDMAYYVLSATHLLDHGLQSPVDFQALADNRDFSSSSQLLTLRGLRPGTQIAVGAVSGTTGLSPVSVYMPMFLAITLSAICATAALAMQASRRWWAAALAAALLAVSPLAAYGVMLQLLPQDWGLGLAAALFAWLMRPEIYSTRRPPLPDVLVICVLGAALFVVAYEVASALALAYGLFLGLLIARRRLNVVAAAALIAAPLVTTIFVVNTFLPRAYEYLTTYVLRFGTSEGLRGLSLFGYAIVPSALPGVVGLRWLFARPDSPRMGLFIVVAAVLIVAVFAASAVTAWRGSAAGIVVLSSFALAALLVRNGNDFGLFKLYMYVQPFVAATVAVFVTSLRRRAAAGVAFVVLAAVVAVQLQTQDGYVDDSRSPIDLPHASDADLLPRFRDVVDARRPPLLTITDHFVLLRLQGAVARDNQLFFVSRDPVGLDWERHVLEIPAAGAARKLAFRENRDASRLLSRGPCVVSLPSGSQYALNRRRFPEGSPDLVFVGCRSARSVLAFVVSSLGQPATLPDNRQAVSFWQLENDPWFPGRTLSGFGRYALFHVLGASPTFRVALEFTTSPTRLPSGSQRLPRPSVLGADSVRLDVRGSGSARVISPPLRPWLIGGRPYLVLDMGQRGEFPIVPRPGVSGLWGRDVLLDPRRLTSYVRDVSLVSPSEYAALRPPTSLSRFPDDLGNRDLEYSGIYEDGWISRQSYATLAGGPAATLVLRADVLPREGGQRLRIDLNGRRARTVRVDRGTVELRVPLEGSERPRRIGLTWSAARRLSDRDPRVASARLLRLEVTP